MTGVRLCHCLALILSMAWGATAPIAHAASPGMGDARIEEQASREWIFAGDGVRFDNRFEGARLNGVQRLGRGHYRLTIAPEVEPVNPSPWYAFDVVSQQRRMLKLELDYAYSRHRYRPWLQRGDGDWQPVDETQVRRRRDGNARLVIDAGPVATRVAAQPMVRLEDMEAWAARLARRLPLDVEVIGASVHGRPIRLLAFGNADARRLLVVIGRQHPPETTGARALMKFVDALAAGSPEAQRFRQAHRVVVVPVLNPDGVAGGHWRTNANGADINRDWGLFRQPETRAVRDALWDRAEGRGREVVFALDFHSTWSDVFYTVEEDPSRGDGGMLREWLDAMQARFPGRMREVPSAASSSVFKNWAFRRFGAPAVTYEVGDNTDEATLQEIADAAAAALMAAHAPGEPAPVEPGS